MNKFRFITLIGLFFIFSGCVKDKGLQEKCFFGAFINDVPSQNDINSFMTQYGKKPDALMIFSDWDHTINSAIINSLNTENIPLIFTWEPWHADKKEGIDYDGLLAGKYDDYIKTVMRQLEELTVDVYIRFGHEMNGNWYPWNGEVLGPQKYIQIYQYVFNLCRADKKRAVKWIFAINHQNIPQSNNFKKYYPGDDYVDFIGIDGYNWGTTQSWSKWTTFNEIFGRTYAEIITSYKKPVLITEFGCTTIGGNKTEWIADALSSVKKMNQIKGLILFNVDKETDWRFTEYSSESNQLKSILQDPYFN